MKIISTIEQDYIIDLVEEHKDVLLPFLDIESGSKTLRQKGRNMVNSKLQLQDLLVLPHNLREYCLVRPNNLMDGGISEISQLIAEGYINFMIPYIDNISHIEAMKDLPHGASYIPLLETVFSIENAFMIEQILKSDYFHIGLNDLSLQMGLSGPMEVLVNSWFQVKCEEFVKENKYYGIGGIGSPLSELEMEINPRQLASMYQNLGSNGVILSRSFHECLDSNRYLTDFELHLSSLVELWR